MKMIHENLQSLGHHILACGPETGHSLIPIAFCESKDTSDELIRRYRVFPALMDALEFCRSKIGKPYSIEIKDDLEKIDTFLHSLKSEG